MLTKWQGTWEARKSRARRRRWRCRSGEPFSWSAGGGRVSPLGPGAPLAIHSVLYQQAGHYRCYAPESDQLNAWRTHNVHLKVTGMPMVVASNLIRTSEIGQHIDIVAEYCANPGATKILWLLPNARAISPGTSYGSVTAHNITDGNTTDCHKALLQVNPVQIEHNGDFSLLVWSGRGIGQITIRLNVTGSPVSSRATLNSSFSLVFILLIGISLCC